MFLKIKMYLCQHYYICALIQFVAMYRPFKTGSTNYNLIVNSDLVDERLKHLRKFCTITDRKKIIQTKRYYFCGKYKRECKYNSQYKNEGVLNIRLLIKKLNKNSFRC